MSTGLHIETVDRIGIIRLDRPAELNALTFATVEEIAAQVQRWEVDGETDGVVITGSGQRPSPPVPTSASSSTSPSRR